MTAATPKTKSEDVKKAVDALVASTTRFLAHDDISLRRLVRQCEQLMSADPASAHSHLASVYQLTGDREKTLRHRDNSIQLAPGEPVFVGNKASNLANLGYFSEAQSYFVNATDPERGHMSMWWPRGYIFGSFQAMRRHLEKAETMQLNLTGLDVETAVRAAAVLDSVNATDADVGKVLDVLGGVVREHRLFFAGQGPQVVVFDDQGEDPFIEIVFDYDVSPTEAHALYVEFVDRVLVQVPAAPSVLTISCRSWGKSERSAA